VLVPKKVLYEAEPSTRIKFGAIPTAESPALQSIPSIPQKHEMEMSRVVNVEKVVLVACPEHTVSKAIGYN
jgi:hypothetical protein